MKNKFTNLLIFTIFFTSVIGICGCATLGPKYKKVEKISDKNGLVYIYRPSSFIGAAVSYDVKSGNTVITNLPNGGYYPYLANPGKIELWAKTEAKSSVTLDVNAGQTYYVKGTLDMGILVGRPNLIIVSTEIGEKEIEGCNLVPEEK